MTTDWGADPFGVGRAMEAWRQDQRDRRLAEAVRRLLRSNRAKAPGWCPQKVIDTIGEDRELTAYFRSVAVEGEDAWQEEVQRLRRHQARRRRWLERRTGYRIEGTAELSVIAITDLLPTWREWGRMLIDAGAAPGM